MGYYAFAERLNLKTKMIFLIFTWPIISTYFVITSLWNKEYIVLHIWVNKKILFYSVSQYFQVNTPDCFVKIFASRKNQNCLVKSLNKVNITLKRWISHWH